MSGLEALGASYLWVRRDTLLLRTYQLLAGLLGSSGAGADVDAGSRLVVLEASSLSGAGVLASRLVFVAGGGDFDER